MAAADPLDLEDPGRGARLSRETRARFWDGLYRVVFEESGSEGAMGMGPGGLTAGGSAC